MIRKMTESDREKVLKIYHHGIETQVPEWQLSQVSGFALAKSHKQ